MVSASSQKGVVFPPGSSYQSRRHPRTLILEVEFSIRSIMRAPWDEYLNSYIGKTNFNDLMDHARSQMFSFEKEFEMEWAQSTIETALRLYPAEFIPLTNQTEWDVLKKIWVFIDKAFDDVPVDVRSGEMECTFSSLRRNKGPDATKRKFLGHKTELLMKAALGDYGRCEAGKADKGAEGTKEKYEAGLKVPKMLKDMIWALPAICTETDDLLVVGLIISGLKIFALLMDQPSTYSCRITRTQPIYFPGTIDDSPVGLGTLVKFVSQVKQVIMSTYTASKHKTIQSATMENCLIKPEQLQPCVTSPKPRPARRQKKDSSSTSSSMS
ncbi:hypothetical protein BJV82DRAFT_635858 [Fennellomyces sp. T-0311]|nr:hypothetical protein BJV82DRAFT_635858 [Fennellomyces sp. T-0311]